MESRFKESIKTTSKKIESALRKKTLLGNLFVIVLEVW